MRKNAKSNNSKTKGKSTVFDTQVFLDTTGVARKVKEFKKAEVVYTQGDTAKSVMYIRAGGVKLSVINEVGKEAVVAILKPGGLLWGRLSGWTARTHGDGCRDWAYRRTRD